MKHLSYWYLFVIPTISEAVYIIQAGCLSDIKLLLTIGVNVNVRHSDND